MSVRAVLKRIQIVLDAIHRHDYPSKKDLVDILNLETGCSARTFDRVLETLRDDYGCEILYDSKRRGYYIDKTQSYNLASLQRLLALTGIIDVIQENITLDKQTLGHIQFEYEGIQNGVQYLSPLLNSIKEKRIVHITHRKYQTEKSATYDIHPYLLKEYQGRWYLLAFVESYKDFRTFGLDRILSLEITAYRFIPDETINIRTYFEDVVGIVQGMSGVQVVELLFSSSQSSYIKSQPLHKSQKVVSDDGMGLIVQINVCINYELIQKIMMHGPEVKVLQPKSLVNDIKERLTQAKQLYDKS